MEIKHARFLTSSSSPKECPPADRPEYAFIGRSNVGKSSLINMLCGHKGLAKTSGRPGKTQLINHFDIDGTWYLVDLPGYGYAQISKKERIKWQAFTWSYLKKRENLMCVFVLVDGRISPQQVDLDFMNELGGHGIPFVIVFTKMEKVKAQEKEDRLEAFTEAMLQSWEIMPPFYHSSATSGLGKEEILAMITETNTRF
ncbi:MAG: ribosome biogenesis GTP-binding protein YihA/YsxC [Bacteroidetes bacterium]|jgi:GTP-binding protein|nr:ribosome biogenesis GTP-binding protein YihA/YsxC [Bacteroidota bacterium]